jgi:hypothetical protein
MSGALLKAMKNGCIGNLPNRRVKRVKLEDYYSNTTHSSELVKTLAISLVMGRDKVYTEKWLILKGSITIELIDSYSLLYLRDPPLSINDLLLIDHSILITSNTYISNLDKLREEILVEIRGME